MTITRTVTVAAGAVIGAVFDSPATGETEYARQLLPLLTGLTGEMSA
jgi:hypothetical protein